MPNFVKRFQFTPSWFLSIATILLLSLFISLGCWQLHRAKEKEILLQQFEARLHSTPVPLTQLPKGEELHFYPVSLTGHFDNSHSILLDNKIQQHQIGYEILTPFIDQTSSKTVLINRGWIPRGINRSQLPFIAPANEQQAHITGKLYIPLGKPFTLGKTIESDLTWPLRIQALELSLIETKLGKPLYPFVVLLDPDAPYGFTRNWQPINTTSPEKHIGYAVQWFTFALVLIIIFIALNFRRARPNV